MRRTRSTCCARAANGASPRRTNPCDELTHTYMAPRPFVGSVARSIRVCFGPRGGAFTPPPSHAHCNGDSGLASCWRRWRRTKAQRGVAATSSARCGRKKLPHLPTFRPRREQDAIRPLARSSPRCRRTSSARKGLVRQPAFATIEGRRGQAICVFTRESMAGRLIYSIGALVVS